MKKILWALIALIIILPIAWYLLSPLFITVELDEASPLQVKDSLDTMSFEQKAEFEAQVEAMKEDIKETQDSMPSNPQVILEGDFQPRAHSVMGEAKVIDTPQGKVLRFENFETDNGPALYIYLSNDLGDEDFVDLGRIKATKGNINYEIPEGTDLEKYNKVLVWCRPFSVLFSYASLE